MNTEKSTQNHFKIIQNFLLCCFKKLKEWALRHRFGFLVGAAVAGWGLMSNAPLIICYLYPTIDTTDSRLTTSLTVLFLSLPVLCLLWFFRTHDTKEQIQKTQANINTSMLHKAIDLALASRTNDKNQVEIDPTKRAIGLNMLAQLRRTDSEFKIQIDFVTKGLYLKGVSLIAADLREVDLRWVDLREADLRWADLQGADLRLAKLQRAKLQGAKLQGAHLQRVDLREADLQEVDLRGIDLREANLQKADFRGARYDNTTRFPPDFNRQGAGMIKD